ncbi:hypothetical protein SODG_005108 [Sodalis praecaptivus]
MKILGFMIFLVVSLFQFVAIMEGLEHWLGLNEFFSFIIGIILTYIPVVGQVIGTMGAIKVWYWEWWQAIGLFWGSAIAAIALGGGQILIEWMKKRNIL